MRSWTIVDSDGTIIVTRYPNIFLCTDNLDAQKYSQITILEKPNVASAYLTTKLHEHILTEHC